MRKLLILLFVFLFMSTFWRFPSKAISAQSVIAVESTSFDVYYEGNSAAVSEIASVTKIMTAVVALELCDDLSRAVSVPDEAVGVEGSSIYLKHGETMSVEDLVWAVLLNSANDAATALAIAVGGSVSDFVELMNQKAALLCMNQTVYMNPHGLPQEGHVSSAYDQALLTCYALSMPEFVSISSSYTHYIPYDSIANGRQLVNHNKLLRSYDGCIGVKTGYTKSAGRCLVSAAERDGVMLVCVTLGAPDDWNDHRSLLDTGFERYERVILSCAGEQGGGIPIAGEDSTLLCANKNELTAVLPRERAEITKSLIVPHMVYAGDQGTPKSVGRVEYRCGGRVVARDKIYSIQEIS